MLSLKRGFGEVPIIGVGLHTLCNPSQKGRENSRLGPNWVGLSPTAENKMNYGKLSWRTRAKKLEEKIVAVLTMGDDAGCDAEKTVLIAALSRQLLVQVAGRRGVPRNAICKTIRHAAGNIWRGIGVAHRSFMGDG
jgi:hypothetical protein